MLAAIPVVAATGDDIAGPAHDINRLGRDIDGGAAHVDYGRTSDHHGGRRCHIGNSYWLHSAAGEHRHTQGRGEERPAEIHVTENIF